MYGTPQRIPNGGNADERIARVDQPTLKDLYDLAYGVYEGVMEIRVCVLTKFNSLDQNTIPFSI